MICLDSDDNMLERQMELDVRVRVRDQVPNRVQETFADYMIDDSDDENYGKLEYS